MYLARFLTVKSYSFLLFSKLIKKGVRLSFNFLKDSVQVNTDNYSYHYNNNNNYYCYCYYYCRTIKLHITQTIICICKYYIFLITQQTQSTCAALVYEV